MEVHVRRDVWFRAGGGGACGGYGACVARGRRANARASTAPSHRVRDHIYPVRVYIYLDLTNIYELQ